MPHIHSTRQPLSLCCDRPTERDKCGGSSKTVFRSAVPSMLSRPARGPDSCFGLLLIKPIMSWKVSLQWVCVCVSIWQNVCVLNVEAKTNTINHSYKLITPPLVVAIIDLSTIQNLNKDMDKLWLGENPWPKLQMGEKYLRDWGNGLTVMNAIKDLLSSSSSSPQA